MKKGNIIILVILLVIGFSSVSTALLLKGDANIGAKDDDFDVIFTEALLNDKKPDGVFLLYDKKEISFQTEKFENIGDASRLDYKVKNNSTQYGADVTINCNNYGNEYVKVEGYFDGNKFPLTEPVNMNAQEIKSGYITVELVKSYPGNDDIVSLTCSIVASATSREEIVDYVPIPYKDEILNGTDPVLNDGLIPVTIADDGIVKYANIEDKWYDYENKKWANAVILVSGTSGYKKGDVIPEEKIESYFVWVPRYKYQIFDEGNYTTQVGNSRPTTSNAKEIQVVFESKDIPPSNGRTKGTWLTHPAFTNFNVNGIWVAKFETGYKGATSAEAAQVISDDSSKVIVKPNVYSWRNNIVANMFKAAYNYKRNVDSHMMKNTEWGAVAYLSNSKYGICKEININNNSSYLTGYSSVVDQSNYPGQTGTSKNVTLPYTTNVGYLASTTGNITGIYDMSGGAHEYVAAYMDGYGVQSSANPKVSSGFTAAELNTYAKYFDKYPSDSTVTSWNNRILGDATGEIGPFYYYLNSDGSSRYHSNWYADHAHFISSTLPWVIRGGRADNGFVAGQFLFHRDSGNVRPYIGFRIVLAPQ